MSTRSRTAVALLAVLTTGLITSCGAGEANTDQPGSPLHTASAETVMNILPNQTQISNKQPFAYLMANPVVSSINLDKDQAAAHRTEANLTQAANGNAKTIEEVNSKCAIYEQTAIGLISTPSAPWSITGGARRNIIIGQSGIDQINGYTSALSTESPEAASALLNDFKSNSVTCNDALKQLYPSLEDRFTMQPTAVDAASGNVTLRGTYNGKPFTLQVTQEDKYLFSTWFTTIDDAGEKTIDQAADTVQALIHENINQL